MFQVLEISIYVVELLAPIEARIRRVNRPLADQISRASESVVLNLGESRGRCDGDRRRHFEFATGSAEEVTVALRIARAKRYASAEELAPVEAALDRVRAMLYRLRHPRVNA